MFKKVLNNNLSILGDSDAEKGENALKDTEDETETDTECGMYEHFGKKLCQDTKLCLIS